MLHVYFLVLKTLGYTARLQLDCTLQYKHKGTELRQLNFGITPALTSDCQAACFRLFWCCIYFHKSQIISGTNP